MRIYLVGYMYCGKTTVGRQLADRLGFSFVDTDQLFENKYKITIPLFLQKYDEPLFRRLESEILRSTSKMDNVVVATGGGTPCHYDSMRWILENGSAVYLELDLQGVMMRQSVSRHSRPLLSNMTDTQRHDFVARQLALRTPIYSLAPITIDALHPDIEALVERLKV